MKSGLFAITFLAFSLGYAYDLQPFVNTEMQNVEATKQGMELKGSQIEKPTSVSPFHVEYQSQVPYSSQDKSLRYVDPMNSKEQPAADMESPQAGYQKSVDPLQKIQNDLADKDRYEKERNNYRKALQREFVRKAAQDGIEVNRNIAEELKELEKRVEH